MPLDELLQLIPPVIVDSDWLEDRRERLLFVVAREGRDAHRAIGADILLALFRARRRSNYDFCAVVVGFRTRV
jgi:hypothetical protein